MRRGGAQLLGAAVPHVAVHDDEGPRRQQECLRTVHKLCRRSRREDLGAGDGLGGGGDDGDGPSAVAWIIWGSTGKGWEPTQACGRA